MNRGIAVLLQGTHADLFACLRALELAARTRGELHAIAIEPPMHHEEGRLRLDAIRELQKLGIWFGEVEGVKVACHRLEAADDHRPLIDFIIDHRIVCLMMGAKDQAAREELRRWAALLRQELPKQERWYFRSFWTLVTEPWDGRTFDRVLERFRRYRAHAAGME
ncbi:MAG: hypothetical protein M0017_04825 [Desulfobacteraceae bacterium]|nr:hypothetical protein [Desulfobacteraceae bacterium]